MTTKTKNHSRIFKYLYRDGDPKMSIFSAAKRQLSEWSYEKKLVKKKTMPTEYAPLVRWIRAYHMGMFFRPLVSEETSKIKITLNDRPIFIEFRHNQSDLYILRENFVYNIYDFEYKKVVSEVTTIVDLGANIGLSSLYFQGCFPDARIVCVDPVKENVELIHKNAKNNNFSWIIERVAVQAKPGKVKLYPNEWWSSSTVTENVANARQSKKGRFEHTLQRPVEEVEAVPVDKILDRNKVDTVDILKMDIEGAEEQSLLNSEKWLHRVKILNVEIHDKYVNRKEIMNILSKAGFEKIPARKGPTDIFVNKGFL